jgi:threonine dehydrogenase-like Zn-dependent dehydrogenase
MRLLLAIVAGSQAADLGASLYGLTRGNLEANPVLAGDGPLGLVAAKLAAVAALAAVLAVAPPRARRRAAPLIALACAAVVAVAAHNIAITL